MTEARIIFASDECVMPPIHLCVPLPSPFHLRNKLKPGVNDDAVMVWREPTYMLCFLWLLAQVCCK